VTVQLPACAGVRDSGTRNCRSERIEVASRELQACSRLTLYRQVEILLSPLWRPLSKRKHEGWIGIEIPTHIKSSKRCGCDPLPRMRLTSTSANRTDVESRKHDRAVPGEFCRKHGVRRWTYGPSRKVAGDGQGEARRMCV
jgi:hypothetical protein